MQFTILGTSCMVPTKDRNHQSIYLERDGTGFLFDCGENTQRQLKIAKIKPSKISYIFISHWHGDHVLGLPGLIQTMAANNYEKTLHIFGPKSTKIRFENMQKTFIFDNKIDIKIHEIENNKNILEKHDFKIKSFLLNHGIETYGFKFIENDKINIDKTKLKELNIPDGPHLIKLQNKQDIIIKDKKHHWKDLTTSKPGKIFGIISDTKITDNCYEIAKDCNLLFSECTYMQKHVEFAEKYFHLTAKQISKIALQSDVKKLILLHFSQRYKTTDEIESETKEIFENSICAFDFIKISL